LFFTLRAQNDANRDFDRGWREISGNIDLYAHELRHLDGFPHVSCCGIPGGCDQTYDETKLSPYGIQWWLNAHWLSGTLYVGFSCLAPTQINEIADWHQSAADTFRDRFCDTKPPVLMRPAMPGGRCIAPSQPENINALVQSEPLPSTFTTPADPAGCPAGVAGTFRFAARLTAKASSPSLTDLRVQVQTLTNGNLLQNADGGPGGVGATLTVPQADAFADGLLRPEEAVDVPFVVCLQERSPFRFLVDVLGIVSDDSE
jgi:hypothetical protein